jgi:hypothetical protein
MSMELCAIIHSKETKNSMPSMTTEIHLLCCEWLGVEGQYGQEEFFTSLNNFPCSSQLKRPVANKIQQESDISML